MRLLVGLGNPGPRYAGHRHNIGFMAVERLLHRHEFGPLKKGYEGLMAEGRIAGAPLFAFMPQTYMNLSGRAVAAFARFYKIPLEETLVIHDELDLPLGKIRVKQGGGAGGHNGLKSLDALFGNSYWRLRLGIGHPGHRDLVSSYVLSDFAEDEEALRDQVLERVTEFFPLLVTGDANGFMSKTAQALNGQ